MAAQRYVGGTGIVRKLSDHKPRRFCRSWWASAASTPLPQASCAAGELICRRAGRGASSGPEKLRPEEAADGREPKAGGEGEEDQGSRRGRGCGAGMRCYQQVNNVWGVYNTSCPPGAPPELPSSTRQASCGYCLCPCMSRSEFRQKAVSVSLAAERDRRRHSLTDIRSRLTRSLEGGCSVG